MDDDISIDNVDELFQAAADHIQAQVSARNSVFGSRDFQLSIYGLYKQALVGPCNVKKPSILDMTGRAKWDAWNKLGRFGVKG